MADALVIEVYRATKAFPSDERFGLQSQLRRAAVSVATNLIEGCARRSERDYLRFVDIAIGSASEVRYLTSLAIRLGFVAPAEGATIEEGYGRVVRALQGVVKVFSSEEVRSPKSEVPSARR